MTETGSAADPDTINRSLAKAVEISFFSCSFNDSQCAISLK